MHVVSNQQLLSIHVQEYGLQILLDVISFLQIFKISVQIPAKLVNALEETVESGQELEVGVFQFLVQVLEDFVLLKFGLEIVRGLKVAEVEADEVAILLLLGTSRCPAAIKRRGKEGN